MAFFQLFFAVLALTGSLAAQYTTGRLEGRVSDAAGAPAPGVAVVLKNTETGLKREYTSSENGLFVFPALPPGSYELSAVKAGFSPLSAGLRVYSSQTTTQNLSLKVGTVDTRVDVVAEATPELRVSDAERGVTRNSVELSNLPNASRNIVNVITLAPGVTPTFNPRGGNLTTLGIAQAGQLNANGGRSKASAHYLDFTDANDWEFGGIALATQPTPDMLAEVKVLTNNWNAEFGLKSNAQVVMLTRSGTNQFHGTAYNFLQNARLNSRDYFDATGKATPIRQNIFGFTAGGALWKDKTFLFGGYEGRRTRGAGSTVVASVPTQIARDSVTDPSIRSLLQLLPLPAAPTANPRLGTIAVLSTSPSQADLFLVRGDHYFTPLHSLAVRYFQNLGTSFSRTAGSLPDFDATFDPRGRNAMIADNWTLSPRTTNELRLAYGRSSALFSPATTPATPRFTVPGLVGFGTVQSWPQGRTFNVYQLSDTVTTVRGRHLVKAGADLRQIRDSSINDSNRRGVYGFASLDAFLAGTPASFTQVFGNTYRGFQMNFHGFFVQDDWKIRPNLTLNLGLRYEYQGGMQEVNQLQSVLDTRLTAGIGQAGTGVLGAFRNEKPSVEANPALFGPRFGFAWNPGAGRTVLRGGYGIFYDSFIFNGLQAGRTTPPSNYTGALAGAAIAGSNSLANLLAGTAQLQRDLASQVGSFGALRNLGSITSETPQRRSPYAQHFSLGVQRRLTSSLVADLAYVGTKGTALTTLGPANSIGTRPAAASSLEDETARLAQFQAAFAGANGVGNSRLDPRFNDVSLLRDNGSSIYHSMQFQLRQSLAKGLQFTAGYTWSKSIDNASDYSPGQTTNDRSFAQNQFDMRSERGVSAYDIPHRFILSHVWQLPFFAEQKGVAGKVLGGWTFSSINQWQQGIPYTVMSGPRRGISDVNLDGNASGALDNARASCLAGGSTFKFGDSSTIPVPALRGVNGSANSANFKYVQPLLGNNGTCGRNTERINSLLNFDWTLSKNIKLLEPGFLGAGPIRLEYRADIFNVFNTPYLTAAGDDYRNVSSPNFGIVNAAGATRRIQMALRLTW